MPTRASVGFSAFAFILGGIVSKADPSIPCGTPGSFEAATSTEVTANASELCFSKGFTATTIPGDTLVLQKLRAEDVVFIGGVPNDAGLLLEDVFVVIPSDNSAETRSIGLTIAGATNVHMRRCKIDVKARVAISTSYNFPYVVAEDSEINVVSGHDLVVGFGAETTLRGMDFPPKVGTRLTGAGSRGLSIKVQGTTNSSTVVGLSGLWSVSRVHLSVVSAFSGSGKQVTTSGFHMFRDTPVVDSTIYVYGVVGDVVGVSVEGAIPAVLLRTSISVRADKTNAVAIGTQLLSFYGRIVLIDCSVEAISDKASGLGIDIHWNPSRSDATVSVQHSVIVARGPTLSMPYFMNNTGRSGSKAFLLELSNVVLNVGDEGQCPGLGFAVALGDESVSIALADATCGYAISVGDREGNGPVTTEEVQTALPKAVLIPSVCPAGYVIPFNYTATYSSPMLSATVVSLLQWLPPVVNLSRLCTAPRSVMHSAQYLDTVNPESPPPTVDTGFDLTLRDVPRDVTALTALRASRLAIAPPGIPAESKLVIASCNVTNTVPGDTAVVVQGDVAGLISVEDDVTITGAVSVSGNVLAGGELRVRGAAIELFGGVSDRPALLVRGNVAGRVTLGNLANISGRVVINGSVFDGGELHIDGAMVTATGGPAIEVAGLFDGALLISETVDSRLAVTDKSVPPVMLANPVNGSCDIHLWEASLADLFGEQRALRYCNAKSVARPPPTRPPTDDTHTIKGTDEGTKDGASWGLPVALAVGALLLIVAIAVVVALVRRRRRHSAQCATSPPDAAPAAPGVADRTPTNNV